MFVERTHGRIVASIERSCCTSGLAARRVSPSSLRTWPPARRSSPPAGCRWLRRPQPPHRPRRHRRGVARRSRAGRMQRGSPAAPSRARVGARFNVARPMSPSPVGISCSDPRGRGSRASARSTSIAIPAPTSPHDIGGSVEDAAVLGSVRSDLEMGTSPGDGAGRRAWPRSRVRARREPSGDFARLVGASIQNAALAMRMSRTRRLRAASDATRTAPDCPTWNPVGRFGGAFLYTQPDAFSIANGPSVSITGAVTMSAWFYPNVLNSNWRIIITKIQASLLVANYGIPHNGGQLCVNFCTQAGGWQSALFTCGNPPALVPPGRRDRRRQRSRDAVRRRGCSSSTTPSPWRWSRTPARCGSVVATNFGVMGA